MEQSKLLTLVKRVSNNKDAIGMILSNYIDFGGENGGMISINQFDNIADTISKYFENQKRKTTINKTPKKKCDYCKKMKAKESSYFLYSEGKKEYWVCAPCNDKHDVV